MLTFSRWPDGGGVEVREEREKERRGRGRGRGEGKEGADGSETS